VHGDFEFIEQIGSGAFSVVYLVKKKDIGELLALKSQSIEYLMK
jgi:serine/threonine protein kinase